MPYLIPQEAEQVLASPFFRLHPFFVVLLGVMICYAGFVMLAPLASFLMNSIRHGMHTRDAHFRETYKTILFAYMMSGQMPAPVFEELKRKGNKRILVDQIYALLLYLEGDEVVRLRALFNQLELYKYVIYRLASPFGYKKAYYLKRLSITSGDERALRIAKSLANDRNMEVRMAAIQTIIRMQPEQGERFLFQYRYKLSLWEQMCYYDFFAYGGLPIPDFHPLVFSKNDTIVLFAIRMIRMFDQRLDTIEGYGFLLTHPNLDVQGEMFRTLAEFGYTNLGELRTDFLPKMPLLIQMQIMTFLAKRPESTFYSMMKFYTDSDSPEFRLHILYCIYNFIRNGKEEVEQLALQREDKMLHDLSSHLITNVL